LTNTPDHRFQVNLSGIIHILSKHLYSGPDVYLRELLQNCVDAISARKLLNDSFDSHIDIELIDGDNPTLIIEDNGIGLTEEEAHQFLATIGLSSKKGDFSEHRNSFIGQFGIGLLSCFMVCDEIVLITRSAKTKGSAIEWRGKSDGSYSVKTLKGDVQFGTKIFIKASAGSSAFFKPDFILEKLRLYGSALETDILFDDGNEKRIINETPPWRAVDRRQAALDYAAENFNCEVLDVLELNNDIFNGFFYLLGDASPREKPVVQVYIRNMLINDSIEKILPSWASLFRGVINTSDMTPSASRETLQENNVLEMAREQTRHSISSYMNSLPTTKPEIFDKLIRQQSRLLKAIAIHDDDFFRLVFPHLRFETNHGDKTVGELKKRCDKVFFVTNIDDFRRISPVALSLNYGLINAGYSYEPDLMQSALRLNRDLELSQMDDDLLSASLKDMDEEIDDFEFFKEVVTETLEHFACQPAFKVFQPESLPVLYSQGEDFKLQRMIDNSQKKTDGLWGELMGDIGKQQASGELTLNMQNPLILSLCKTTNKQALQASIKMLYIQSLLLGHYPLNEKELDTLHYGMWDLIRLGLKGE